MTWLDDGDMKVNFNSCVRACLEDVEWKELCEEQAQNIASAKKPDLETKDLGIYLWLTWWLVQPQEIKETSQMLKLQITASCQLTLQNKAVSFLEGIQIMQQLGVSFHRRLKLT